MTGESSEGHGIIVGTKSAVLDNKVQYWTTKESLVGRGYVSGSRGHGRVSGSQRRHDRPLDLLTHLEALFPSLLVSLGLWGARRWG